MSVSVPDDLRGLLGVDVRFEKLDPEEQIRLHKAVTNLAVLGSSAIKTLKSRAKNAIEAQYLDKPLKDVIGNRTMLRQVLGNLGDQGPLGLGLLPAIFGEEKKVEPAEQPATPTEEKKPEGTT